MTERPPGGRLPAANRRRQIVAAALPVFAWFGRAGAGTRRLARAARVSEPILYRHFRSKDALFGAVLAAAADRLAAALDAAQRRAGRGARVRLLALAAALPALIELHGDELRVLCGAAAARGDAASLRPVRRGLDRIGVVVQRSLRGGLRRGLPARIAATFVLEVGLGAALLRPAGAMAAEDRSFGQRAAALLLAALLSAGRPEKRAGARPHRPSRS